MLTLGKIIAISYSNLGKSDRAREILDQFLAAARTIEDMVNQVTIMGAVSVAAPSASALHYAEIGQVTTAKNERSIDF